MTYEIRGAVERDKEGIFYINTESDLFATAKYLTGPHSIDRTLKSCNYLLIVAEHLESHKCVGYVLGKMKTKGICLNLLHGVNENHRRRGLGIGVLVALMKLCRIKEIDGLRNKFYSWKLSMEVPDYNKSALKMYKDANFQFEGLLKRHTRAKTDMHIVSFFMDEQEIPEYGDNVENPAEIVDDSLESYLKSKLRGAKYSLNNKRNMVNSSVGFWLND
jgi:hypothetical protein